MQVSHQLDLVDSYIHTNRESCKINSTNSLSQVTAAPNKPFEKTLETGKKTHINFNEAKPKIILVKLLYICHKKHLLQNSTEMLEPVKI